MQRYRLDAYIAFVGDHDEHATYDAVEDDEGEWVRCDDAMAELARLRRIMKRVVDAAYETMSAKEADRTFTREGGDEWNAALCDLCDAAG